MKHYYYAVGKAVSGGKTLDQRKLHRALQEEVKDKSLYFFKDFEAAQNCAMGLAKNGKQFAVYTLTSKKRLKKDEELDLYPLSEQKKKSLADMRVVSASLQHVFKDMIFNLKKIKLNDLVGRGNTIDKPAKEISNTQKYLTIAAVASAGLLIGAGFVVGGGLPYAVAAAAKAGIALNVTLASVKVAVAAVVGALSVAAGAGIYKAGEKLLDLYAYYTRNAKQVYKDNVKDERAAVVALEKELPKKTQDKKFIKDLNKLLEKGKARKFTDEGNEPTKADHIKQPKKGKDTLCLLQFANKKLPKVVEIESKKKRHAAEAKLLNKIAKEFKIK